MGPADIIARIIAIRGYSADHLLPPEPRTALTWEALGIDAREVKKIMKRLRSGEKIVVYGDYDVDGVNATTILWRTLRHLGYNVMPFIPLRDEGYGFTQKGIERCLATHHPSLIIAVDHGIAAGKEIQGLQEKGIDVIVLDHHRRSGSDPQAFGILYSTAVSASGLAYIFARTLLDNTAPQFETEHVALAGIASITDIMPQRGLSRSLSYHGVRSLGTTSLHGLRALLTQSGLGTKKLYSSYDIGYVLGPRVNAAGRMGDALDAMRMLCADKEAVALKYASILEERNSKRQAEVTRQLAIAHAQKRDERFAYITSPHFSEGLVGLIAGRLVHEWNIPVLVGKDEGETVSGSIRSIKGIDIIELLGSLSLFSRFGGHARAGGFCVTKDNSKLLYKELQERLKSFGAEVFKKVVEADMELPLNEATYDLALLLEDLEPFGEENEEPIFKTTARIVQMRRVGSEGKHVQYLLENNGTHKAILFNAHDSPALGSTVTINYSLRTSHYKPHAVEVILSDIQLLL